MPPLSRSLLLLTLLLPARGWAQGLPAFAPLNPVSSSRSGLYYQPLREPVPGRWITSVGLDYGSLIEYNQLPTANYVLDSELLRLSLGLSRDLSPGMFLLLEGSVGGAYGGFMDGFLDWYHGALGIRVSERERRPRDRFLYEITPHDEGTLQRSRSSFFLGDLRLGLGLRPHSTLQSVVSITLPTTTAPPGYGRRVPSLNLLNTVGTALRPGLHYEGSVGIGFTPRNGSLAALERELFLAVTSGLRMAVWRHNSVFANVFYHSPYYHDTTLPSLDRRELSLDFGWIIETSRSGEWRVGLTEDLEPGGPGVDLVFRVGRSF